jgi:AraC-like DNA-binding protein
MTLQGIDLNSYGIQLYESKHREGDVVEEHSHNVHQILYAIDGRGAILLDGKKYEMAQDNMAFIVPFSNHEIVSNDQLTLLVLGYDTSLMESRFPHNFMNEYFPVSSFIKLNPFNGSDIRYLLRKMLYEQSSEDALSGFALTIYVHELLLILAKSMTSPQVQDANSIRAERIRKYFDTYYYEMITASDVALKLGISTRYVNLIFKEQFQMTPMQYLNEVRIKVAKKMLAKTEKDIVSICFEVGYDNISTFYRTFKNVTQLSPNKYRQSAVHKPPED